MPKAALFVVFAIVGVALALFLGGCASFHEDGYPIKTGIDTMPIQLQRTGDAPRICDSKAPEPTPPGWKTRACSERHLTHCTIYIRPSEGNEVLGEELRHCFDGAWHK